MNQLEAKMKKRDKAVINKKQKTEKTLIPSYDEKGNEITAKVKRRIPKSIIIILAIIAALLLLIYLPGYFMKDNTENNVWAVTPDSAGIKALSDYVKENPNEDTDNDGIINSLEWQYGTSPRFVDTDNDGVSDYAELFITNSNPLIDEGTLENYIKQKDKIDIKKPFKSNTVILWADDVSSYIKGGAVLTLNGYRVCNFKGWAQFPVEGYAYKIENDVHIPLEYRETENAWRIDDDCEIVISSEPLKMVHVFHVIGFSNVYINDNFFGKILSAILPSKGLITCSKVAKVDTWKDTKNYKTNDIKKIEYERNTHSRFGENHNGLTNLSSVYITIKKNENVLVSLCSSEYGEYIAEVYGITANGNLLLANPDTLEPIGILDIEERIGRYVDQTGKIGYREWFEFKGLGFDSHNKDSINFFASSNPESDFGKTEKDEIENTVEQDNPHVQGETETKVDTQPVENISETVDREAT